MNDSPHSAAAPAPAPPVLGRSELPAGWQQAERDEWVDPYPAGARRRLALRIAVGLLLVAGVIGTLVWVAAGHYARGVDALSDGAYSRAAAELSAATVLVFPYRDARALEQQARQGLQAEIAAREAQEEAVSAVVAQLRGAGARLEADDAAGVLAALAAIPADELRSALVASDEGRQAVAALTDDLAAAATAALRKTEWTRAERFAAALLVLKPSSTSASALEGRALTGEKLSGKLAKARDAARAGRWRAALKMALAVTAVQKGFPGAASLIADARTALKPKPKPTPTPVQTTAPPPAPVTGGSTTPTPPQPPPP